MKGASLLIFALILMAGCIQPEGSIADREDLEAPSEPKSDRSIDADNETVRESNGTATNQTLNLFDAVFNVQGCETHNTGLWHYEKEPPQPPEGYAPASDDPTDGRYYAYLLILECDSLLMNNETLLTDVNIAWSGLPVDPDEGLDREDGADVWMYELFTDSHFLHETMLAVGLHSTMAEFAFSEPGAGSRIFTITVDGEKWYETQLGSQMGGPVGSRMAKFRTHQFFEGQSRWMDFDANTPAGHAMPPNLPVLFTAHAGVLEEIMGTADMIHGHKVQFSLEANFRFGRTEAGAL